MAACKAKGKYPLLLTSANTAGEKPYEEFVGKRETTREIGLPNMLSVPYAGLQHGSMRDILNRLSKVVTGEDDAANSKDAIKAIIGSVEPDFLDSHIESKLNLDQRV